MEKRGGAGSIRPRNLGVYSTGNDRKSGKGMIDRDDDVDSNSGKSFNKNLIYVAAALIALFLVYSLAGKSRHHHDNDVANSSGAGGRNLRNHHQKNEDILSDNDDDSMSTGAMSDGDDGDESSNHNEDNNHDSDERGEHMDEEADDEGSDSSSSHNGNEMNHNGDGEDDNGNHHNQNQENGDEDDDDRFAFSTDSSPHEQEESSFNDHQQQIVNHNNNNQKKDYDPSESLSIRSWFENFGKRPVNIDKDGSYKYVLILIEDPKGKTALMVQGCPHKYGLKCKHPDAYKIAQNSLSKRGYKSRVLGGGRITRHGSKKASVSGYIAVFGTSKSFGACDDCNEKACKLIKAAMPTYFVHWSNQGYKESDERGIKDWVKCE